MCVYIYVYEVKWKWLSCDSLRPHGLYSPWNFPGQNTGVGSLSLLRGIFPTQGSNPGLQHCRQIFTSWATREAHIYVYVCVCVCVYTYIYHPTTKCSFDSVCRLVSRGHYMIKFSTNSCPWNRRTQIWVVCPYGLCYLYILTVFYSLLLPPHYLTQDSLEINFTN